MANSLAVKITADVADLQAKFSVARAETNALTRELNALARQAAAGTLDAGGAATMRELAASMLQARSAANQYSTELARAGVASSAFSASTSNVTSELLRLGGITSAIGTVAALSRELLSFGEQAEQLRNYANILGLTIEQYQGLGAAAIASGIDQEQATRGIERLNQELERARGGSDQARAKLLDIGLTLEDIQNPAFATADLIARLGTALNDTGTRARTHEALVAMLGPRYANLTNVLQTLQGEMGGIDSAFKQINGLTEAQNSALASLAEGWHTTWATIKNAVKGGVADIIEGMGAWAKAEEAVQEGESGLWAAASKQAAASTAAASAAREATVAQSVAVKNVSEQQDAVLASLEEQIHAAKQGTEERLALEAQYYSQIAAFRGADDDKAMAAYRAVEDELLQVNARQEAEAKRSADERFRAQVAADNAYTTSVHKNVEVIIGDSERVIAELQRQTEARSALAEETKSSALARVQSQLDSVKEGETGGGPDRSQVAQTQALIAQEIVIWHDYYDRLRTLADGNATRIAILNSQELTKTSELTKQSVDVETAAANKTYQAWSRAFEPLSRGLASAVTGVVTGTETMSKAFQRLAATIIEQGLRTMIQREAQTLIAIAMNKTEAKSDAAVAATGAFKAVAGIPYIGPFIAPVAAAAVYAGAMAYGAEGGFDVPAGMNPGVQLHQREMVLPAPLADRVRDMTDTGGGGEVHYHVNVAAMDAHSVRRFFNDPRNVDSVMSGIRQRTGR